MLWQWMLCWLPATNISEPCSNHPLFWHRCFLRFRIITLGISHGTSHVLHFYNSVAWNYDPKIWIWLPQNKWPVLVVLVERNLVTRIVLTHIISYPCVLWVKILYIWNSQPLKTEEDSCKAGSDSCQDGWFYPHDAQWLSVVSWLAVSCILGHYQSMLLLIVDLHFPPSWTDTGQLALSAMVKCYQRLSTTMRND